MKKLCRKATILGVMLPLCSATFVSCGRAGDSEGGGPATSNQPAIGVMSSITGSITSLSTKQKDLEFTRIVLFEKDTGIARVGAVNLTGNFTLNKVRTTKSFSMAELAPDFTLISVFGEPTGTTTNQVKPYFKLTASKMPPLLEGKPYMQFNPISSAITMESTTATLPSVLSAMPADSRATPATPVKYRLGIPYSLMNDDDGDGVLDVFDSSSTNMDIAFAEGIEYFNVRVEIKPTTTAGDTDSKEFTLVFQTKVRDGVTPTSIKVLGPNSEGQLLESSSVLIAKDDGTDDSTAWGSLDYTLKDDGKNTDGSAGDGIWGRRVLLADGKVPLQNQMVFLQLKFTSGKTTWTTEYPFMFELPPTTLTAGVVALSCDADKVTFTTTDPFTGLNSANTNKFNYYLSYYAVKTDGTRGARIYTSSAVDGADAQATTTDGARAIPSAIATGQKFFVTAAAQSAGRGTDFSAYVVYSADTLMTKGTVCTP